MNLEIENSRRSFLHEEFDKEYFKEILTILKEKKQQGEKIFPPLALVFNAFNSTPFEKISVVILGQDPYHGLGQAHGLSFSVPEGVKVPPSLRNIYKEIVNEYGGTIPDSGNLIGRAEQGVLLLNAVLTVEAQKPASHKGIGWGRFTDAVIKKISDECEGVVFMLRGNFAKSKSGLIDGSKHLLLESGHPSPLSAYKGFFGCNHFIDCNNWLEKNGKKKIDRL